MIDKVVVYVGDTPAKKDRVEEDPIPLEAKLESLYEVHTWDFQEGEFTKPQIHYISIPHVIPTEILYRPREKNIIKAVEEYKTVLGNDYQLLLSKKEAEIKGKREGTKRWGELDREIKAIQKFLDEIDKRIYLRGPRKVETGVVYHLITPPFEQKKYRSRLPRIFLDYLRPMQIAEMELAFPYGILRDGKVRERVDVDSLLEQKAIALDYETHNWKKIIAGPEFYGLSREKLEKKLAEMCKAYSVKFDERELGWMTEKDILRKIGEVLDNNKDEKLTIGVLMDDEDEDYYLISTLPNQGIIKVDHPAGGKVDVKIISVRDQKELMKKNVELLHELEVIFVDGHYHMKFDYGQAEKLTGEAFLGINRKPQHIAQVGRGFIVRRDAPGRITQDPSGFAQHSMALPNNKLDTVLEHVMGMKSGKTLTHAELFIETGKAESGDIEAADRIHYYAAQDGLKSRMIGRRLRKEHVLLEYALRSAGSRIDTTAKKTLAVDYWTKQYFKRKHTVPKNIKFRQAGIKYDDFDIVEHFKNKLEIENERGLMNAKLIAVFPYSIAFRELLERDEYVKELYALAEKSDARGKVRIYRYLEELAKYPLFLTWMGDEFSRNMGVDRIEFNDRIENIEKVIHDSINGIKNSNNEFYLVEGFNDVEGIVHYGDGLFINGTAKSYIGNINGLLWMQGVAHWKSNKGERCAYEKNFYETWIEKILFEKDIRGALEFLLEQANMLKEGVDEHFLTYSFEAKKDYTQQSVKDNSRKARKQREQKAMKGDIIEYSDSIIEAQKKFFGLPKKREKNLFDDDETKGALGDGTIHRLVNWVFNFKHRSEGEKALRLIYQGKGTQKEIGIIINSMEQ